VCIHCNSKFAKTGVSQKAGDPLKRRRNFLWYSRMFGIGLWFAIISIVCMPITFFRFHNPTNNTLFLWFLVPVARRILGLKVVNIGVENIPKDQPSVFVMNHQANLDILLNADVYPRECLVIAKRELAFIPVFGWLFYFAGNVLLRRSNKVTSKLKVSEAGEHILKNKVSIWIFPEGTRSHGSGLGNFKKGAFHLALETGAPLVPVVASDYVGKLDFSKWKSGTVTMRILDPILPRPEAPYTVDELSSKVRSEMLNCLTLRGVDA
jgi:1-acyl-sn-glycerol-3-phosphate acyltransferase